MKRMKRMLNANFASDRSDNEGKRGVWDAYGGAYGHRTGKKRPGSRKEGGETFFSQDNYLSSAKLTALKSKAFRNFSVIRPF